MMSETGAAATRTTWRHWLLLSAIVVAFIAAAGSAMRHTSTTFDEILLPSAGARGYTTGSFEMITLYHPPVLQYVYGLPVALADFTYPAEMDVDWNDALSFFYARTFYFGLDNDPRRLAFLARTMGVAIGALLILVTFLFTRTAAGPRAAVLAAALVAFLPDVLAHSGISYNDVPVALVVLFTLWSADAAIRDPRPWRAALCGAVLGLALGVKFSAVALGPAGLLLLIVEAVRRWPDPDWVRRILLHAAPLVLVALYVMLVIIYLGDFALVDFRAGLLFNIRHATFGHGAPAVLLGRHSVTGWWYFFPVAFFLKTSAGLHLLMLTGLTALLAARPEWSWRGLAASPVRVPAAGALVFLGFVMAAKLNIGFRHALPILPLVCILTACAVSRAWAMRRPVVRFAVVLGAAWHILSSLSAYPWFLSYLSEYTGPA
ncbi:MAG: glycosyltransferase family 39 protein, partial [Longimicrobiales bacterium]